MEVAMRVKCRELPVAFGPDHVWLCYCNMALKDDPQVLIPGDVSGAFLSHTSEVLSPELSGAYALWSRSAEYAFMSRACAIVDPQRVLGGGLGLVTFSGSLRRRGARQQC
eukprot:5833319-Pyramimonas_sp.AAC.1